MPHELANELDELCTLNSELASLLHRDEAQLHVGSACALRDDLVVCGILGGKDVGKSTLINALARTQVSFDTAEAGRGTDRPAAYVHAGAAAALASRLGARAGSAALDLRIHEADAIADVVLVDMPDFDSEFDDHLRIVRAVTPLLDRVLWVQTPRKLADREWVETLAHVVKDSRNVYVVLNKVDELLADGQLGGFPDENHDGDERAGLHAARKFWQHHREWVGRSLEAVDCPRADKRGFMVAAAFPDCERFIERIAVLWDDPAWSRYSADRPAVTEIARLAENDLERLRRCVLAPVSRNEARALKLSNRNRELRANVKAIGSHYDLDRAIALLERACEPSGIGELLQEAAGQDYALAVASKLESRLRTEGELADALTARRVEEWPLLRIVYWPFGWLSRLLGRRFSDKARAARHDPADPFDVDGRGLAERSELIRSRVLADNAAAVSGLEIKPELPKTEALVNRAESAVGKMVDQLDARLIDEIELARRPPSRIGRAALWFILLWFPLLQPLLEGGLEVYLGEGSLDLAHGLLKLASALSAGHLIASLAVVVAVFVAVLAGMYARSLRIVKRHHETGTALERNADAVDGLLVREIIIPLIEPFRRRLEHLRVIRSRLNALAANGPGDESAAENPTMPHACNEVR